MFFNEPHGRPIWAMAVSPEGRVDGRLMCVRLVPLGAAGRSTSSLPVAVESVLKGDEVGFGFRLIFSGKNLGSRSSLSTVDLSQCF